MTIDEFVAHFKATKGFGLKWELFLVRVGGNSSELRAKVGPVRQWQNCCPLVAEHMTGYYEGYSSFIVSAENRYKMTAHDAREIANAVDDTNMTPAREAIREALIEAVGLKDLGRMS